jgi:DNA repair protein RadC
MNYTQLPIPAWAAEDRPREKMLQKGLGSLTDAELLAIILGQGTVTKEGRMSALDLARQLIETSGGLDRLARSSVRELTRHKGIGNAKAIAVVAAFELGRRKASASYKPFRVKDSAGVAQYLQARLADHSQEVFIALFFNRNNELLGEKQIFQGGVSATIIDAKLVYKEAINHLASAIIVAHNHPSGNLRPSQADLNITRQLKAAGELFDIQLLDHLIVSFRGYYSFADEGIL